MGVIRLLLNRNITLVALGFIILLFAFQRQELMNIRLAVLNRLRPDSFDYLVKAKGNYDLKALDSFEHYYQKVAEVLPERPDAHGLYAYCAYYGNKPQQAINAYERAIKGYPKFFWFHHNLGVIYYREKDYDKAIESLRVAIGLTPDSTFRLIQASQRLYLPLLFLKTDEKNIERYILSELKDGYLDAYRLLVVSLFNEKKYQDAILAAQKAVELKMGMEGFFYYYVGAAAFELEKYQESVSFLQQAIKISPESYEPYEYLAKNLKVLGKPDMAAVLDDKIKQLKQINPNSFSVDNVNLGMY